VIWNGGPHYALVDDQGGSTRLMMDESLARALGGPLAINRKRVRIVGEQLSSPPGVVRVQAISLEPER
jgi:hypothetical protein